MKPNEKALLGFEAKAKKIILKYSITPGQQSIKYGYLRLSGFFSSFNSTLIQVDEELTRESFGILNRYINKENIDFTGLIDGLREYRLKAKRDFILNQQP